MHLSKEDICEVLALTWTQDTGKRYEACYDNMAKVFVVAHDSSIQTIDPLEAVNTALGRLKEFGMKAYGEPMRGEYIGPITYLRGKTALLRNALCAQFDDRGTYFAHGWHNFAKEDFRITPLVPLYKTLATMCQSRRGCEESENHTWFQEWTERIERLVKDYMPSGSGLDAGTTLDLDESNGQRLVFHTEFHHMDEHGGYDGWTKHAVTITGHLAAGFSMRVTGPNRNAIRDYIAEVFDAALNREVPSESSS